MLQHWGERDETDAVCFALMSAGRSRWVCAIGLLMPVAVLVWAALLGPAVSHCGGP